MEGGLDDRLPPAAAAGSIDAVRMMTRLRWPLALPLWVVTTALALTISGCRTAPAPAPAELRRRGDEIVVCGRLFHTGTPVVLWTDPGGYDAYRVERRFVPLDEADWEQTTGAKGAPETPARFGLRKDRLTESEVERVRGGGWDLPLLQRVVDQFVLHYDACGTSRRCFQVLHDQRGLSVHFLLDVDGTVYQTLDLKERAWHATTSNSRSIGIEIAHPGAVSPAQAQRLEEWYAPDADRGAEGGVRLRFPAWLGETGIRTPGFSGRPRNPLPVVARLQGRDWLQYDFTPEQYAALARLTAALCRVFPRLPCDAPRGNDGQVVQERLPDEALGEFQGILGHFHIQTNKVDPGPAFAWESFLEATRRELGGR